jgi:hypothetical protein
LEPTEDVFAFLRYLALVEPQEATPIFSRLRDSEDYNLIVTARDRAGIPAALAARSYVISSSQFSVPVVSAGSRKIPSFS